MNSAPLIRHSNADGYVPRWLDERLAEALEHLPKYGQLIITVMNNQVESPVRVELTHPVKARKKGKPHES